MKKFEEISKEKVSVVEKDILKVWKEQDILNKTIENRSEDFVFYDGPATANGMPGVHHMLAKFLKDTFCKYKATPRESESPKSWIASERIATEFVINPPTSSITANKRLRINAVIMFLSELFSLFIL